jgi:hypothetical protein
MKAHIFLIAISLGLFTASSFGINVTSTSASGTVAIATTSQPSNSVAYTKKDERDEYGSIDGQSPFERYELVSKNPSESCFATFTRSVNRGNEVTVLKTHYENGGLMERYYIKEQGGRWYYASHFSAVRCK